MWTCVICYSLKETTHTLNKMRLKPEEFKIVMENAASGDMFYIFYRR